MIKKRVALFVLLLFLSLQAFAFVPLLLNGARLAAAALRTPVGTAAMNSVLATGLAIQVITALRNGTDGSSHSVEIYTTNTPRPPSAEEAAAGFTGGFPSVAPPTNGPAPSYWYKWSSTVTWYSDPSAACAAYISSSPGWTYSLRGTAPGFYCDRYASDASYQGYIALQADIRCPDGYSISGSSPSWTCVLSNPVLVKPPSDGFCPIVRTGHSYGVDPADPDCTSTATPQFLPDGSLEIYDDTGHSIKWRNGSKVGEHIVTERTPTTDANGNPTTTEKTIVLQDGDTDADPAKITGQSQIETPGQGVQAPPVSPDPPIQIDTSAITAAIAAQTAAADAREQARIAKENADRELPFFNESIPKDFIPVSISSINFTSAAACPADIGFSMLGKTYSISYAPMCNLMSTLRPMFLALGAFGAAFIFMGGLKT